MKVLAMYLPQFHRTPENDKWWGEGFTDWVAVKNAKSLYEGHKQPRIPLGENYYDLLEKRTMEWQADLMHEHGVDGVCIYHYWFEGGRQVLNRPMENLLEWKDLDMPFCVCWANEVWARSWSAIKGANVWADKYEKSDNTEENKDDQGLLLGQNYNDRKDWVRHFDYISTFLEDDRYIRIDNKPVIIILCADRIGPLNDLIETWRSLADKKGLPGLYIICGGIKKDMGLNIDGILFREPADTFRTLGALYPERVDHAIPIPYKSVCEIIEKKQKMTSNQPYFMAFVDYDTTPRKGCNGNIICNSTPESFGRHLTSIMIKSKAYDSELVFVNAWNEWGESMYLEPDSDNKERYLEAIADAKRDFEESCKKPEQMYRRLWESVIDEHRLQIDLKERINTNLRVESKWLDLYEVGIDLADHIKKGTIGSVAIYGLGILGKRLYKLLRKSDINIAFIADRVDKSNLVDSECPFFLLDEEWPYAGSVIVTAVNDFDSVFKELKNNKKVGSIVSLETLIDESLTKVR